MYLDVRRPRKAFELNPQSLRHYSVLYHVLSLRFILHYMILNNINWPISLLKIGKITILLHPVTLSVSLRFYLRIHKSIFALSFYATQMAHGVALSHWYIWEINFCLTSNVACPQPTPPSSPPHQHTRSVKQCNKEITENVILRFMYLRIHTRCTNCS